MTTVPTSKAFISVESEIEVHRVVYHWDIKNFDRISSPDRESVEPVTGKAFRSGVEIGRDSEWLFVLKADQGILQMWLYLQQIYSEDVSSISVHLIVTVLSPDGVNLLKKKCDKYQTFTQKDNGWGMGFIIPVASLWEEPSTYLVDNTLRLRMDFDIMGATVCRPKRKRPSPDSKNGGGGSGNKRRKGTELPDTDSHGDTNASTQTLKRDFRSLLRGHVGADFFIHCENRQFPVHRVILTARSKVFDAMLKHDTLENRQHFVRICDLSLFAVGAMLDFIYTGEVQYASELEPGHLLQLIAAGDKYDLDDLKRQCFNQLLEKLSNETCGQIAVAAYLHGADVEALREIRTYWKSNWDALMKVPEFKECLIAAPRAFFEDIKGVEDEQCTLCTCEDCRK